MLDAGAGTGFTTEGIVARVEAAQVTMLDQSPHQLARSRSKPALADCPRVLGDAENLPFADDTFDRYVSAGSIEYWPDPQRGIAEAYRVTRAGGTALVIGPVRPANRVARALAETWMLFPAVGEYTAWMEAAGFTDVRVRELAPDWYRDQRAPYALAVSGVKPAPGPSPAPPPAARRGAVEPRAVRLPVRGRLGRGRRLHPDRGRAHAPRPPRREARRVTIAAAAPRANPAVVLWRFSRPHTIIGTALSVVGLYLIAAAESRGRPGAATSWPRSSPASPSTSRSSASTRSPTSRSTASTSRGCRSPPATSR